MGTRFNIQVQPDQQQEVYLSFRYRGVGDVVIIALYENDQFYLPVSELFSLLQINHQVDMASNRLVINGFYLEENQHYEIDFTGQAIQRGNLQRRLGQQEQLIGDLDFYLLPVVFEDVFGLDFSVDMSNLQLRLETDDTMPVIQRLKRRSARGNIQQAVTDQEDFPLAYNRQRHILGGAFVDYSLSGNVSDNANIYNYNLTGGAEVIGGDVQGTLLGTLTSGNHLFRTNNLRWRYVIRQQSWISEVQLGQLRSEGLNPRGYTGLQISNEPVQPRRLYDEYQVRGTTAPESEVEVYLNNRLVEFSHADELGNYNFSVPLTYGSSRLRIMRYNPDGSISEQNTRLQIPYTFLPPGEISYFLDAGLLDNPATPGDERSMIAQTNATYGLTNWLTGKAGVEYFEGTDMQRPMVYSSFSARIASQYLVNADIAPDAYYRLRSSIVYPNSISWGAGYTHYTGTGLYNRSGNDQDMDANLFLPFSFIKLPVSLRLSGNHRILSSGSTSTQIRSDLNMRVSRANFRFGYRQTRSGRSGATARTDGYLSGTATYSIPRKSLLPAILAGTYLRTRLDYRKAISRFERFEMQISKTIWNDGRLRLAYERNFIGGFNSFQAGLTFDFNRTRSTSTSRYSDGSGSIRHNIRGSMGYDSHHNKVIFDNRQQVGRSAASVRMFIDKGNTGRFDEGDEIIPDNAIRLRRAGTRSVDNEGITRVSQLQAYYRHNIEINESAIRNPTLVPKVKEFSFIGDPNSYKTIDIPFYVAGIIEGGVTLVKGDSETPQSGIRVNLKQTDGEYETVMRTFSDGGFYAMEIPPGQYEARVDRSQLTFLNAFSEPEVLSFEVKPVDRGDYVEGLNFRLIDRRE